jgi:hypothetical protein
MEKVLLSNEELETFKQNGYVVIKGILDSATCKNFDRNVVQPALFQHAGILEDDSSTWNNSEFLKSIATADFQKDGVLKGVMVRKHDGSDPISDENSISLDCLNPILHQLHGGTDENPCWDWIHSNVGWIHVRFPLGETDEKYTTDSLSWHVDGGHFSPHYLESPEQSVIILPMIRDVADGGGNTVVLKKSHIYIAQELKEAGSYGISKDITQNLNRVAKMWPNYLIETISPCKAGDILLMHPLLVHTAGRALKNHPLRIAFNMGVKWKKDKLCLCDFECNQSWMEKNLVWCLNQSLDFIHEC